MYTRILAHEKNLTSEPNISANNDNGYKPILRVWGSPNVSCQYYDQRSQPNNTTAFTMSIS